MPDHKHYLATASRYIEEFYYSKLYKGDNMFGYLVMVCLIAVCDSHQTQEQPGQEQPYASGNDYHCNPSFHIHSANKGNGHVTNEYTTATCQPATLPRDCVEVQDRGNTESGQYLILPQDDGPPFRVNCDMDTDDGGWLVFQRREDGSVGFYRTWTEYETGFGNTNSEHWLGNENIHRITAQGAYELRIDLADFQGNTSYAKYKNFRVGDSTTDYMLLIGGYSGNAGDSMGYHNGAPFSAKDADHDTWPNNCAVSFKGAWWYKECHNSNLNGQYLKGPHESNADGVNWKHWTGHKYSLKYTEMKIRRKT